MLTVIYKYVFPGIWICVAGIGTLFALISRLETAGLYVIGFSIGCIYFYWCGIRLKSVEVDKHYLYISNYSKTIKIPFSEIKEVTEARYISIHPVWIEFKNSTAFGKKIVFMPKYELGSLFMMSHPVVKTLRDLARSREYIPFDSATGYPFGKALYYECLKCGQSIPSQPEGVAECACKNISIDGDVARVGVLDHSLMKIYRSITT